MSEKVAIILAAGMSSRMKTMLPKVMHEICGRPMLAYVLDACRTAGVQKCYVIVGYGKEHIIERFGVDKDITFVEQVEQKGTGHAVMCCKEHLADFDGDTLVICGDMPLIRSQIIKTLLEKHEEESSTATLATAILVNPKSYGRIVRDTYGNIQGIVEEADCTEQQKAIQEVNPSYYCFKNKFLFEALDNITPNNAKNEYYLTDALHLTIKAGHKVTAVTAVAAEDAMGVNDRSQLSEISRIMQGRIQKDLMDSGVTIVDPDNTWIDVRTKIGQDTVIEPFTYIHGKVQIGSNCRIGPFAYLRDGTVIGNNVLLGVFTEVKNSTLADGVSAKHRSYIGDAMVGKDVNIGPGTNLIEPLDIPAGSHIKPGQTISNGSGDN